MLKIVINKDRLPITEKWNDISINNSANVWEEIASIHILNVR